MWEYQITVSKDGGFFFRTDWDDNAERMSDVYCHFCVSFDVENVRVYRRPKAMDSYKGSDIRKGLALFQIQ